MPPLNTTNAKNMTGAQEEDGQEIDTTDTDYGHIVGFECKRCQIGYIVDLLRN